jgi:uncharacterized protein (TIGR03118 family)
VRTLLYGLRRLSQKSLRSRKYRPLLENLEDRCLLSFGYLQTNLVSDIPGLATSTDPNLINPWGFAAGPHGPLWVSDNGTGVSTLYSGAGQAIPLVVHIPTANGNPQGPTGSPSGIVFNGTGDFVVSEGGNSGSAFFIFATEDGTISGWNPGVDLFNAVKVVDNGGTSPIDYTGLAIGNNGSDNFLYVADAGGGAIHVFNKNFAPATLAGSFTDPALPPGYTPYDIQNIDGQLYVTYVNFGAPAVPGNGLVDRFDTNGNFERRLVTGGNLNLPWGLTIAPKDFGDFSGALLVGNLADGLINAYNPVNGDFRGQLQDPNGNPIAIPGLWGLHFGNGGVGGDADTLFFTAGINFYGDGLLGSIQVNRHPVPSHRIDESVIPNLPPSEELLVSTVPPNGDVNPYGIAYVPPDYSGGGVLNPGDLLVSNFNNGSNLQGTGTTVTRIQPNGQTSVFFQSQSQSPVGLTTALGVLKSGFVLVGNVPTTDGSNVVPPGSLIVIDGNGNQVANLTDPNLLDGPWDLTINDQGTTAQVFVSNVLSGTVTRIDLSIPSGSYPVVVDMVQIASGYLHRTDPAALVVGPTGLAFDPKTNALVVASTGDNAIFGIGNASTRTTDAGVGRLVYQDDVHLHGPLALAFAPNGDLITANGDAVNPDPNQTSELVEFTPFGQFVGEFSLNPGAGAAFGLALEMTQPGNELTFAAVDDALNAVHVWSIDVQENGSQFSPAHSASSTGEATLVAALNSVLAPHNQAALATTAATANQGPVSAPSAPALPAEQHPGSVPGTQPLALATSGARRQAIDLAFAGDVALVKDLRQEEP